MGAGVKYDQHGAKYWDPWQTNLAKIGIKLKYILEVELEIHIGMIILIYQKMDDLIIIH